jgi:hypothetical protein
MPSEENRCQPWSCAMCPTISWATTSMGISIDLAVDTGALTAILLGESDAPAALTAVPRVGLCAPSRTELFLVIRTRLGDAGVEHAKELLRL